MSLAANPLYRNIRAAWTNNGAAGDELVQLFVKPTGGAWGIVSTFAVIVGDQLAAWATAVPLTAYQVAMRLVRGLSPAVGYEDANPDNWTASTAAGSKSSVTTTSEPVAWGPAQVTATVATLNWTSAQNGAPYFLEKSTNGGGSYSTVVSDLVAKTYAYTIPAPELNTTVRFRLTAQRGTGGGAIVGPTAGTLDVYLGFAVGTPTHRWTSLVNTFPTYAATFYVSWTKVIAGATADFVQAHWRATGSGDPFTASAIQSMTGVPATGDIPAQADGYVPARKLASVTLAAQLMDVEVRIGISDGVGGITWGAWTAGIGTGSTGTALTAPTVVASAPSSSAAVAQVTVPAGGNPPPTVVRGAVLYDLDSTVAAGWGILLPSIVQGGPTTKTLMLPATWRGFALYETDWTIYFRPDLNIVAGSGVYGHTRQNLGVIP